MILTAPGARPRTSPPLPFRGSDSYYDEVEQLFTNLMNSPRHRANILDADVTSVGIGLAFGPLTYPSGATRNSVLITNNFARTLGVEDFDLYGDGGADTLTGGAGDGPC